MSTQILSTQALSNTFLPNYSYKTLQFDDFTAPSSKIEIISDVGFQEKYNYLMDNYYSEKNLFHDLFAALPNADNKIEQALHKICRWNFNSSSVEITEDRNVIFKLKFQGDKTLYLGLNLIDSNNDSYFGYYNDDKCERNGIGSFSEVYKDLVKFKII